MKSVWPKIVVAGALSIAGCTQPEEGSRALEPQVQERTSQNITQEEIHVSLRKSPRYREFFDIGTPGPIIPGLIQSLIPQAAAYVKEKNWMVTSHYDPKGRPSLLSVTDLSSGKLIKTMNLYTSNATPYTGHAGGLAISKEHIWLSSGGKVYRIKLNDLIRGQDQGKLIFEDAVSVEALGSFLSYADEMLWVGEIGGPSELDPSHQMIISDNQRHHAWAVGYRLSANDTIDSSAIKSGRAVPDVILSIPDKIQGMVITGDRIVLSESYGRKNDSALLIYEQSLKENIAAGKFDSVQQVPVLVLDERKVLRKLVMPPMSEGIFEQEGKVYVLFESGATEFSDGSYPLDRSYIFDTKSLFNRDDFLSVPEQSQDNSGLQPAQSRGVEYSPVQSSNVATIDSAAIGLPRLIITEIVPQTEGVKDNKGANMDAFEMIEIYNGSSESTQLKGYKIKYKQPNGTTDEWTFVEDRIIPVHGVIVVWNKQPTNPYKVNDFIEYWNPALKPEQVTTITSNGMNNSSERQMILTSPNGEELCEITYNNEAGDVKRNKSILFAYQQDGSNRMRKSRRAAEPTPGALEVDQQPVPNSR